MFQARFTKYLTIYRNLHHYLKFTVRSTYDIVNYSVLRFLLEIS